ncbi:MAG: helix-turn-helix transcriptional regulator [Prevotella sp.]|nr:helix-turn-helix transcriptional regulator [Prevotella sp.]
MVTNELFRQCLSAIPEEQRAEFDMSYGIAERLDTLLKQKGITQHELAVRLGKRDSEVSKWLTGRHNFTTSTIARIETAVGDKLIMIAD